MNTIKFCALLLVLITLCGCIGNHEVDEKKTIPNADYKEPTLSEKEIPYDSIEYLDNVGGKLLYTAIRGSSRILVYNGTELRTIDASSYPVPEYWKVDGKLAYEQKIDGKRTIIYDGTDLRGKYDSVYNFVSVNGIPAYVGERDGKSYVVYDGKEISGGYDIAYSPQEIDGKLAYKAAKNGEYYLIYDGKEVAKEQNNIICYTIENDKPVYVVKRGGNVTLVYNGQEKEYDSVIDIYKIAGKVVYQTRELVMEEIGDIDGKIKEMPMTHESYFYDGQKLGSDGEEVSDVKEIDGKLAYLVVDKQFFIVYDGKEGKPYSFIESRYLSGVNGKLAYVAEGKTLFNRDYFIVYDGEEIGKEYDGAYNPKSVNGKLAYVAEKKGKYFVVYDGNQVGGEYDNVFDITEVNGKIVFAAEKNGKGYIISEE